MKRALFWAVLLLVLSTSAVAAQQNVTPDGAAPNSTIPQRSARYRILYESTWSQETHPHPNGAASFPSNPHISPLVGALHNLDVTFWQPGSLASPGVEQVAETGGTGTFDQEIDNAILANNASERLNGSGAPSPGNFFFADVAVDANFPKLTLITMIAPSPDWFAGVNGLSLQDENGQWIDELVIDLYPYDAGTEEGNDYSFSNPATSPPEVIKSIRGLAPFSDQPVGRLTVTRLDPPQRMYLPAILKQ